MENEQERKRVNHGVQEEDTEDTEGRKDEKTPFFFFFFFLLRVTPLESQGVNVKQPANMLADTSFYSEFLRGKYS